MVIFYLLSVKWVVVAIGHGLWLAVAPHLRVPARGVPLFFKSVRRFEYESAMDRDIIADHASAIKRISLAGLITQCNGDFQVLARANHIAIAQVADLSDHQGQLGWFRHRRDEFSRCLHHGFEHHHPGQHGKAGEMVLQILLGMGHRLDGGHASVIAFQNLID